MAAHAKKAQQFARQLFKLSLVDGVVSPDRVAGVLAYLEKHKHANPLLVLRAYRRYITAEFAKSQALVEHAGAITESTLTAITAAMTKKYHRPIQATAQSNPALIAGLRVHVGDDVYESSIAGQLSALSSSAV